MRLKFTVPSIVLLVAGLVLLVASTIFIGWGNDTQVVDGGGSRHTVMLTENGFEPEGLEIKKGDVVTFKTVLEKPFWPASDLHPTHTVYKEFDSNRPIQREEDWVFQFDKEGTWKFHDHLNPEAKGVITVVGAARLAQYASTDCMELESSQKIQCFDTKLERLLLEDGIEAAFEYFVSIYNADPEVPLVCHAWAHRLGEIEYGLYKEGKEIELRPEATFCSYGYFHGFINTMVEDTQSVQSALTFCEEAVKEGSDVLKGMKNNCVHGIGHSIATLLFEDPDYWGDQKKITQKGLEMCTDLYGKAFEMNVCNDGLFHEFHLALVQSDYGFTSEEYLSSGDLFYYCHNIAAEYLNSCYFDFISLWTYFFDEKKDAVAYVLEHMKEPEIYGERAFRTFGRSFIEVDIVEGDYWESVEACDLTTGTLHKLCIEGFATGFVEHGEPGKMHEKGFAFCRSYYEGDAQHMCFEAMVSALSWNYSNVALQAACATLSKEEMPPSCVL